MELVLSVFSGIDLLGRGFEAEGFSVVSLGDIILGHDIRTKSVPAGRFDGVIGGPPCQDFSRARRTPPTGYGLEMLDQFRRIVTEADPEWWLMENVGGVPRMEIAGYITQVIDYNAREAGSHQNRPRVFQFGYKSGNPINPSRNEDVAEEWAPCVVASEGRRAGRREVSEAAMLQGLSPDFLLPELKTEALYKVIGNGVCIPVARRFAAAIRDRNQAPRYVTRCACGCGRIVRGKKTTATIACRKRKSRLNQKYMEKQIEFVQLVKQMREAQKLYFGTRTTEELNNSKKLEALVDAHVHNTLNPKPQQHELFQ